MPATIKHLNYWWLSGRLPERGYIDGSNGRLLRFHDATSRAVAVCLADSNLDALPKGIRPALVGGELLLFSGWHQARVRRLTGPHLRAAIRRLIYLRKKNSNDHNPKNPAAPQRGRQPDEFPTASPNAIAARA